MTIDRKTMWIWFTFLPAGVTGLAIPALAGGPPDPQPNDEIANYGRLDNFSSADGPEPASPSAALVSFLGPGTVLKGYDSITRPATFAETIPIPCPIARCGIIIWLRPLSNSASPDDTITLQATFEDRAPVSWSSRIGTSGGSPGILPLDWTQTNYGAGTWVRLYFNESPGPNAAPVPPEVLNAAESLGRLDVIIGRDTDVDAIQVRYVCVPSPGSMLGLAGLAVWTTRRRR